jgi:hypothetical protein
MITHKVIKPLWTCNSGLAMLRSMLMVWLFRT